jgi:hypothetical protein
VRRLLAWARANLPEVERRVNDAHDNRLGPPRLIDEIVIRGRQGN